jgi:hypothetical protein
VRKAYPRVEKVEFSGEKPPPRLPEPRSLSVAGNPPYSETIK